MADKYQWEREFVLFLRSMDWPQSFPKPIKTGVGPSGYEYRVFPNGRKWRVDFAWPDFKVCYELEGGYYTRGGHASMGDPWSDMEKRNVLQISGWIVLAVPSTDHSSNMGLRHLAQALIARGADIAFEDIP